MAYEVASAERPPITRERDHRADALKWHASRSLHDAIVGIRARAGRSRGGFRRRPAARSGCGRGCAAEHPFRPQRHSCTRGLSPRHRLSASAATTEARARALRWGETLVNVADLVPGDVIVVEPDADVPADARVVTASALLVDESGLTGTRKPVTKSPDAVAGDAALAERRSMLYRGTHVLTGHATAIVTATGDATEIAKRA